jgi:hypothetical protein
VKTQQQADVEFALALLGADWIDQTAFDRKARERCDYETRNRKPGPLLGFKLDDFVPPFGYCAWNRHIWGVQVAVVRGLVEQRRRKGLIEYRLKQKEDRT